MIASVLAEIVDLLPLDRRQGINAHRCARGEAVRIGRNDVWQLTLTTAPRERFFAKFCTGDGHFRREYLGLTLARDLAGGHDWILAPEIVSVDVSRRLLVTRALPGMALHDILKSSYKRSLFARKVPSRVPLESSVSQVIELVRLFQNSRADDTSVLVDYTPDAIASRVAIRANRVLGIRPVVSDAVLRDGRQCGMEKTLVHGDLSPTNIYVDQDKIGLIDFQDLGLGPAFVDVNTLLFHLEGMQHSVRFRDISKAIVPLKNVLPQGRHLLLYKADHLLSQLFVVRQSNALLPERNLYRRSRGALSERLVRRQLLFVLSQLAAA